MEQQKQIQALSDEYQGFQTGTVTAVVLMYRDLTDQRSEMSNLVTARQRLESQQQENKSVQQVGFSLYSVDLTSMERRRV
jgi:hypothetical protein